jgi:hypothetical protein
LATNAITTAADISASGNVLTVDGTNPVIARGEVNCRDGVNQTLDRLIDASPTGVGTAFNDITIAWAGQPSAISGSVNRIAGCTNQDGTGGWYVSLDATGHVVCRFGTNDEFVTAGTVEIDRPNIMIVERDTSTGRWRVSINGANPESDTGNATGEIAQVNGAMHLGMQQTGASSWSNAFEGYTSALIVDENRWSTSGTLSEADIRTRYLKQYGAWCNELP